MQRNPYYICINISSFPLYILTLFAVLLILLLQIVDFEKKRSVYILFRMNLGILLAIQNLQEVLINIQNVCLHWLIGCQNLDFQIVQTLFNNNFTTNFDLFCNILHGLSLHFRLF